MSQLGLCCSRLCHIQDYVAFEIMLFKIMSHSGLCRNWDYVVQDYVVGVYVIQVYVIWHNLVKRNVVQPNLGVSVMFLNNVKQADCKLPV